MVNEIINKKISRKEFIKNVGIISALMLIVPNFISAASGKIRYFDGIVNHNGNALKGVGTPVDSTDATNKEYVDSRTLTTSEVTGTTQSASVNYCYITNNASQVVVTLPSSASVGDVLEIVGKGAGGWQVAQNAGQTIHFGDLDTTAGATGYVESTNDEDTLRLKCTTATTNWTVDNAIGNLDIA